MSPAPTSTSGGFAETAPRGVSDLGGPRGFRSSVQVASAASSVKTGIAARPARLGLRTRGEPHRRGLGAPAAGNWLRHFARAPLFPQLPCRIDARPPHAPAQSQVPVRIRLAVRSSGAFGVGPGHSVAVPCLHSCLCQAAGPVFARVDRTTFYRVMGRHQPGWLDAALMQLRITRGWHRTDRAGTSLTSTRRPLSHGTLRTSCRGRSRPRDILDSAHRSCSHFPLRASDPAPLQGRASIMPPSSETMRL